MKKINIQHSSLPLPPQGLQRKIRQMALASPTTKPYLRSASSAYCEQVGVKRHEEGNNGEIAS